MDWYFHDFGKTKFDVLSWLEINLRNSSLGLASPIHLLKEDDSTSIKYEKFDWSFQYYFPEESEIFG
jgi:hypothetical protein